MLAGLLFATHDADDRPAMLTATLPFGGVTLIEYQARLLVAAGASQVVILVSRLTPELLGAINRIDKRGIAVDTVRTAAEATAKLHPLARVLMLADGLTTTDDTLAVLAREGGDALLVMPEDQSAGGYERVGGGMVWAGVARLDPRRLGELAAMPRDYDVQSTLVRLASQARAVHVLLPQEAVRGGHGVGHAGAALEARGRTVMAAMISGRNGWFERFVTAPLARALIPLLVPRTVPVVAVAAGAGTTGLLGLALTLFDQPVAGLLLTLLASLGLSLAANLADLRDESASQRALDLAAQLLPALAVILYGFGATQYGGDRAAETLAIGLVLLAVLGERALGSRPRHLWWGSAPAYLGLTWLGAVFAAPVAGLGLAATYAAATLAAAIERLRRQA
ncbi:hypothetical protein FHT00_000853 [Sphingomonas insulae]|uniref:Uncharacterized protein n=1 Tax=Sphingomonas insulae TaxID=424800 RepID=A0ABN1HSQ9_9SPHN|nr:hypothetical protein [Sphingomonas insulae]NIJ28920.1 hypothetical protein [Sphingomonas insulae]